MISTIHPKIKALEAMNFPRILTLTLQKTNLRNKVHSNCLVTWKHLSSTKIHGKVVRDPTVFPSIMTLVRRVALNFQNKDPILGDYLLQNFR